MNGSMLIGDFIKASKYRRWTSYTVGDDIANQECCKGFIVTGTGTVTLVDLDGNELALGSIIANTTTIYPFAPQKIKTGSTATIVLLY